MWDDVAEASILVVVGMAVVFAALATLMVAIMTLNRLAPEKAKKAAAPVEPSGAEASEKEKVAVIAVALALAKVFDTTADMWVRLQADFDLYMARKRSGGSSSGYDSSAAMRG